MVKRDTTPAMLTAERLKKGLGGMEPLATGRSMLIRTQGSRGVFLIEWHPKESGLPSIQIPLDYGPFTCVAEGSPEFIVAARALLEGWLVND